MEYVAANGHFSFLPNNISFKQFYNTTLLPSQIYYQKAIKNIMSPNNIPISLTPPQLYKL